MKNFILIVFVLFMFGSCKDTKEKTVEATSIEVSATTTVDANNKTKTCVTCSNGYKLCCDSPKSPNVNCVKKTGSCK